MFQTTQNMQVYRQKKLDKKGKICLAFFTSTRGDMAILNPLLDEIKKNNNFSYKLFVHGTHLEKTYGYTINEIKKNNHQISYYSKTIKKGDGQNDIAKTILLTQEFANYVFKNFSFDAIILLGDRLERLPILSNCILYRKFIFHLHGGELTYGVLDDQVRHIITKASHLHFPICESYKKNIINMSEEKSRILNAGSLAIENILKNFIFKKKVKRTKIILTYHPETLTNKFNWKFNFKKIYNVIKKFNFDVIVTSPGYEKGSQQNILFMKNLIKGNKKFKFVPSLGFKNYFKILNETKFVIGNSSSGIIEVPYFRIPTINIGKRQDGRFQHFSIINSNCKENEIKKSIKLALSKRFNEKIIKMKLYFGNGKTSEKILKFILRHMKNENKLINKL